MEFYELDIDKVKVLAEAGHTDKFMADFFGVSSSQWHAWKKAHPNFFNRLNEWKRTADERVIKAVYRRACGYDVVEQQQYIDRKTGKVVAFDAVKHYPPDMKAAEMWLANRQPEDWGPKPQVIEHQGKLSLTHNVSQEDLEERIIQLKGGGDALRHALQ